MAFMVYYTMTSRWGAQIEGDVYDVQNLTAKLLQSVSSPTSFFITTINDVSVFRCSLWDTAVSHSDAYQLALTDLALIQGILLILDGCLPLNLGTVYEFTGNKFNMWRETPIELNIRKATKDLASPDQFKNILDKVSSQNNLRQAYTDLVHNASWMDIYRCWESLKKFYGGEHKVLKLYSKEKREIIRLKRTANTFRHVKGFDIIEDPMSKEEAVARLRNMMLRATSEHNIPTAVGSLFRTGQQINISNLQFPADQPVKLNPLALDLPDKN